MNQAERELLANRLQTCDTIGQMLLVLLNKYDVNIKPGTVTKQVFVSALLQAAQMLQLQTKKEPAP